VNRQISASLALSAAFAVAAIGEAPGASAASMKVASERSVTGFAFPESVGCDGEGKALYVSEFGSELKPTEKDGQGRIGKLALDGTVLEESFLPASGMTLDKPKGIWIAGGQLWVTDIDAVWQFDLASKEGRKVALPGIQFANDPTIVGDALYVSDNRSDQLYKVTPARFLGLPGEPEVSVVFTGKGVNANGLYPAADGSLLLVGFKAKEEARGIFKLAEGGEPEALSDGIGRLDGIYEMADGGLLVTDWDSGALLHWSAATGSETLASGFTGPADFCVLPDGDGLTVFVPDLVKSEVRILKLAP